MQTEWNFNYANYVQNVSLFPGKYKLECWGACGSAVDASDWTDCAKGGYSKGEIVFKKRTNLQICVGQSGYEKVPEGSSLTRSGFNGAGTAGKITTGSFAYSKYGGGATDIRLYQPRATWDNTESLLSRILVAGGGGGMENNFASARSIGHGGGYVGENGIGRGRDFCGGGSQYQGGTSYDTEEYHGSLGKGGYGGIGIGGGGGWHGGAGSYSNECGGGGSGYALTKDSYKPPGYIPTSEYWLENVVMTTGGNTTRADGYAKITLLQALPFLNISSYNSTTATFKADHTDPTLLTKIEYFIDDVLKETITTDLTLEKTINYTLEDNTLHTLKIVVTDSANATAEKVVSISKGIAPLPAGSTTDEVTSKWIEIKDAFKSGKTSIINTLALKNIEASLNNTIVELSEKIKASFDSGDASLQELQNRITELTNQLSQRIKWASGTFVASEKTNLPFVVPTNLTFVPKIIIMERSSFLDSSSPLLSVEGGSISNLNNIHFNASWVGSTRVASFITRIESISESSFTVTGSSINSAIKFPVYISKGTSIKWYAFDII
ncbi:glycine rich domain-containing protein [Clostridioides difficile]|uniref:glycine rich domain-containing protein n=1 Tax=Clostridioides difficile TaxID=1496 RepID=UPI0021C5C844|nr:glycine rich domain-containing protein [Clostridioides difficile]UUV09286.1 glycine rich domain-containing protein [Clostridioides difficile]